VVACRGAGPPSQRDSIDHLPTNLAPEQVTSQNSRCGTVQRHHGSSSNGGATSVWQGASVEVIRWNIGLANSPIPWREKLGAVFTDTSPPVFRKVEENPAPLLTCFALSSTLSRRLGYGAVFASSLLAVPGTLRHVVLARDAI